MKFLSHLMDAMSGKLNGMVASHNRYGVYCRALAIPTNPNTTRQVNVRAVFKNLNVEYANLTDAQRAAWTLFGANTDTIDRLGQVIHLDGKSSYISLNVGRMNAGKASVADAPTYFGLTMLTTAVPTPAAATPGTVSVAFTNTDEWATATGGYLLAYDGRPQNNQRFYYGGPYQLIGSLAGAAIAPTSPHVFTSARAYASGQKIPFRFVGTAPDGRISRPYDILVAV